MLLLLTAGDTREKDWRKCRPRPGSLFVVGDPKQSIYRFRRAEIVIYNEVKRIICEDGLEARLSVNFRSVGDIVDWVNGVFEPHGEDEESTWGAMLRFPPRGSDESPGYVPLDRGRAGGSAGDLSGVHALVVPEEYSNKPMVVSYETDRIARTIRYMVDSGMRVPRTEREAGAGKPPAAGYDDFMILTRKLENLAEHSRRLRRYGIPHTVTGGSAMNRVVELKLLHACLRAVARPDDPVALVAALRSEVFGVSDAALYDFKVAGGRFSYRAPVPPGLESEDADAIGDAFAALQRYSGWLKRHPPVAAIERILEDSGLMALAAAGPGGDVEAGSLAKALEVLRGAREGVWTTAGLVERLGELVEMEESYDGISCRPGERPAVRVMNLHKAKGLEAPVVFLADPFGESDHDALLHVDRSGGKVLGYMAIDKRPEGGWGSTPLARPAGWEAMAQKEKRFTRAEELRLRYVAATRAGAAMMITEKVKGNRYNPWKYFEPYIPVGREMTDPGGQEPPPVSLSPVSPEEARRAGEEISERLRAVEVPTYDVRAAKEYALTGAGDAPAARGNGVAGAPDGAAADDGEYGASWGTVIHVLLQVAIQNPKADLEEVARATLAENGLEERLAGEAARTANTVVGSGIWGRARRSRRWFAEVPFEVPLEEDARVPTVLRGSIDLVFEEEGGWVLVDYKTDRVRGAGAGLLEKYAPQVRLYAEVWERCTGETVKETALYFVRSGELVTISDAPPT
ncbi:MAG: PD-(D/E)XK nuclease family protein [Actinobacteria bacterium]|nr:PD-(D/E)XK nuclease family protein [Actinomycetota bacterium]